MRGLTATHELVSKSERLHHFCTWKGSVINVMLKYFIHGVGQPMTYITVECNREQHLSLLGNNKLHFNIQTLFTCHTYTPISYTKTLQRALASKCLIHLQLRSTTLQCCVTQPQACRLAGICGLPCQMYNSI